MPYSAADPATTTVITPPYRSRSRTLSAPTATNPSGKKIALEHPVLEKDILATGLARGENCPEWEITVDVLKQLAATTNRFIAAGHRCAWVNGHFGERTRLGDVYQFEVRGNQLFAKFKLLDRTQIELGRFGQPGDETWDEVSVEIDDIDFLDNGNAEQVILAVATVTTPVITGQGPFKRVLSKQLSKPNSSRTGKFAKRQQMPRPQMPRPQITLSKPAKPANQKSLAKGAKLMADEETGDGMDAGGATYITKPTASYAEIEDLKKWFPDIPPKVKTFAQLEIYMEVKAGQAPAEMPSPEEIANAPIEDLTGESMTMSRFGHNRTRTANQVDPQVAALQAQIAEFEAEKKSNFKLSLKGLVESNRINPAQAESLEVAGKAAKWSLSILSPFQAIPSTGGANGASGVKTERRALSRFGEGDSGSNMSDEERRKRLGLPAKPAAK